MRVLKLFLKILAGIIFIPPLIYMVLVIIGGIIPVNTKPNTEGPDIKIYLISNGMHTDIVLPMQTYMFDWTSLVKPEHTLSKRKNFRYIGFGWGDLGFYANTPEWKDLTLETGFKALFLKTPSAVHATFLNTIVEDEDTKTLYINKEQYKKLVDYIKNTFEYDKPGGETSPVAGLHYSYNDAFYRARGSLHLFNTCNTWVNTGLKEAGLKACLWTPFVEGIFYQYP
ncbi:MAG TPA: TIGR02117 family protein [Gillisia sp.]|nr:TIGR02117 family protein [Gillisia sp.]